MKYLSKRNLTTALASVVSASLIFSMTVVKASALPPRVSELEGDWVATLSGNTGCGASSMLVTFHLDARGSGAGTATVTGHSTGCKNNKTSGLDFNIVHINTDGKGVAGLSCGEGCGWILQFQVNRANDIMALTDVDRDNADNTPTGVAIKQ